MRTVKDIVRDFREDFKRYAAKCIKVRDHNTAKILPLRFRPGQRVMHDIAEKRKAEMGYLRMLLLKNRRFGGSTYISARGYHRATMHFNQNVFIIGHETDSTTTLYRMVLLMQDENPIKPDVIASNINELRFDDPRGKGLKSEYKLATAKNVDAGKSQGIHVLHCCLSGDSLLICPDGSTRTVEGIQIGDTLVNGIGRQTVVKNKFITGVQDTIAVSLWLGNETIYATKDHIFFTLHGKKNCRDLTENDWILVPRIPITGQITKYHYKLEKNGRAKHLGGGVCSVDEVDIPLDRGFGYYLGYYLAEGCVKLQKDGRPCTVHFAYHKDEKFIDKACEWFASKYYVKRTNFFDESNRGRTYLYGNLLASLTENICGRTNKKHIPFWFFDTNEQFLHGLLEGYFDGDGSKGYDEIKLLRATSIREKISRQIRRIIISLGYGVPGLAYYDNRYRYNKKTKPIYDVALHGDTLARFIGSKVVSPHRATKYKEANDKYYVKIKSLKNGGQKHTYDLEVEDVNHNFETVCGVVSNSEEAMWPSHADDLLTGLFQCVPRPPSYTEIWRESTGKGYGNTFQRAVFDAYAEGKHPYFKGIISHYAPHMPGADIEFTFAYHNPGTEWVLIFIPWFLDPSCQRSFSYGETEEVFIGRLKQAESKEDDINHEALKLRKQYGLTWEQLYWREWSIKNECNGRIEDFHQENPINVIEAFKTKGSNLYNADFCDMVERMCQSPASVGNIMRRMGAAVMEPNPAGHFSVWERHNIRDPYFITVDAAGGKREIHHKENREPDRTVIDVWNHRTGHQAAQWYGHVDYDMIADVVKAVGEMYHNAIACVELNNTGYKVVGDLKDDSYHLYYYKPGEAGWSTNKKTKGPMALDLLDGCRDGVITIRCAETVKEMRTFIEKDEKYGAEAGCKDDRVTSAQMAVQMMDKLRMPKESTDRPRHPDDYGEVRETQWMAS